LIKFQAISSSWAQSQTSENRRNDQPRSSLRNTTLAEMIAQQWVQAEPVHRFDLKSRFLV